MAFDGTEGDYVTLSDASDWTENFRDENPGVVKAHFLGKDKLSYLLGARGCKGLRIYHAIDESSNPCIVVVGANGSENDLLGTGHKIVENSVPCPPCCGNSNDLNS